MDKRKLGNIKQIKSFYQVEFTSGKERGKQAIIVHNGNMEVLISKDNALDITYLKYKGVNISFMSKNGLNGGCGTFNENFEGGMLYTCGMDNVSSCVKDRLVHGSLHYQKAEEVNVLDMGEYISVSGVVRESGLFLKNLVLKRDFHIYSDKITIDDKIENQGFKDENYVLLYHINFGYPFLDENLEINMPVKESFPLTEIAKSRIDERFRITAPKDENFEDVYYHTLESGNVTLKNRDVGIMCNMKYSTEDFPVTLQWKSMISGDYALGIEPSLTRFDNFKMRKLKGSEEKNYKISIEFDSLK